MTTIIDEASARAFVAALPGVDGAAMARLDQLVAMLAQENARQNLVSAASLGAVWQRHIADTAQLLTHVPRETSESGLWLDLGTGAGFPGLVITVLRPEMPVWLVESRALRVEWLTRAVAALGLAHARVQHCRLENLPATPARVISARAFAPLDRLLALSAAFSTPQTQFLLPKGRGAAQELAALTGWRHGLRVVPSCTDAAAGIIIGTVLAPPAARRNVRKRA